ncbi:MAG: TlpA disulfide reductase family protein [Burkholderiaceae bacterium]|nr:TlpA disulfide reductase family protein [Burkholderiaceae bacterium]
MSGYLRILVVVVVLVLAAGIGFVTRQTMEGNASASFGAGQVASQAASEVFELSGQKFERWVKPRDLPDLRFSDPAGRPTSLSKFQGRMILLNLWATWCPPCREEMPALDRLNARLGGDRFTVVTLALDSPAKADAFLRQIKATTLQNYTDTQGLALSTLGVTTVPTTLLINAQGREIGRLSGAAAWDEKPALDLIQSFLKESP